MLAVILKLGVVGFVVWLIVTCIPMPDVIKKVIIVVVAIAIVLWLLSLFGFSDIPVPHLK